jgi:hypothetical protein
LLDSFIEADPKTVWDVALVALGAIAQAVGSPELESAMLECAHIAYERLFPQRHAAT